MKTLISPSTVLAAILILASSACAGVITIKGSDPLASLAQKLADAYTGKHPEVKIQVSGGGTSAGFAALQEQKTDLANAARHIKYKEAQACIKVLGARPAEYKIGINGLAVYVNQDNPVKQLTLDQLDGIFSGKFNNWKEVGGTDAAIVVYGAESSSAAFEFFKDSVLNGKEFAPDAKARPGPALLKAVSEDKNGIGYGAVADGEGIRALGIKRAESSTPVKPNEETIRNQTYPIAGYFYYYAKPAADKGEVKAYVDWIRGDEGQEIVRQAGFYSLPDGAWVK